MRMRKKEGAPPLLQMEPGARLTRPTVASSISLCSKLGSCPLRTALQQLELILKQNRDGNVYEMRDIAANLLAKTITENEQKPAAEQATQLRSAIERISPLLPDSLVVTTHYRAKLAEVISESGDPVAALNELQSLKASLS